MSCAFQTEKKPEGSVARPPDDLAENRGDDDEAVHKVITALVTHHLTC